MRLDLRRPSFSSRVVELPLVLDLDASSALLRSDLFSPSVSYCLKLSELPLVLDLVKRFDCHKLSLSSLVELPMVLDLAKSPVLLRFDFLSLLSELPIVLDLVKFPTSFSLPF